jgi:hypothetical protein
MQEEYAQKAAKIVKRMDRGTQFSQMLELPRRVIDSGSLPISFSFPNVSYTLDYKRLAKPGKRVVASDEDVTQFRKLFNILVNNNLDPVVENSAPGVAIFAQAIHTDHGWSGSSLLPVGLVDSLCSWFRSGAALGMFPFDSTRVRDIVEAWVLETEWTNLWEGNPSGQ